MIGATVVLSLGIILLPGVAAAGSGQIVPDTTCKDEGDYKSLHGDTKASLTVINNSNETVKTWWLNYDGDRVFYEDVHPRTSIVQPTWLTHPWIIASVEGDCYRFVVMNALEQTVTVSPEDPDPASTVGVVPSRTPPINAPTAGPTVGPATTIAPGPTTAPGDMSDFTWPLILGVLASMAAVLIGLSAAKGKLPWVNRGNRPPKP